ncbi:MAG: endonuclease MutS2 [Firmicutes bacterium]|nr:endonuclease MutS2 [Bacillota bacterium]MDY2920868.1 endonuclease MutS2 [Lentihominibacter sp.]
MKEKTLKVLEYGKIINMLREQAGSEMTREAISELLPVCDVRDVREMQAETSEAVRLITAKGPLPVGGFHDIEGIVSFASKGGILTMAQLLKVLYNMKTAERVVAFTAGEDVPKLPLIDSMTEVLAVQKSLAEKIDRCILSEDEMADNASPELRRIRKAIVRQNEAIKAKINHILNSEKTYLQDAIVTMRNGRYVVPVKQEYRNGVPGIVHDQSGTGATLFVEPQAVVNMNNELRQLELDEKAEINRILTELSEGVAEYRHDLINNQKLLLKLDLINAKGRLSLEMDGTEPEISENGVLRLISASHPLIDRKKVVPVNISIGEKYKTLVITGPNTGGKTVSLKTAGLLSLMAQTGLHIPVSPGSCVPMYRDIFADIGDEQSIEQSLSTFSSHMANIVDIIDSAGEDCLVLLDELGAGTDPTEGAALAIAILRKLAESGCCTMATTHYTELKKYAISTEGVENASMEFDVETLSPTYRLITGLPGKSNAFEISEKLGLDRNIIEEASNLLKGGDIAFEDVIASLEEDRKRIDEEKAEAVRITGELREEKEELDRKLKRLEEQRAKKISDAREEARAIIREAKDTADDFRRELKEIARLESLGERTKRFDEGRRKLNRIEKKNRSVIVTEKNSNPVDPSKLKKGDRVKILTLGQNGEVASLPDDKGEMQVQVGAMKFKVNLDEIMLINDGSRPAKKKTGKAGYGGIYRKKTAAVSPSIDVRGKNLDDALMDVEKYIDDAFIAGLPEVTLIHGRGEGILSKGIRTRLRSLKNVKEYRRGEFGEGGDGVTVVKLKQ